MTFFGLNKVDGKWGFFFLLQVVFFLILPIFPRLWKFFYDIFEWQKNAHISLFGEVPWSMGDVLYIFLLLLVLFFFARLFLCKTRKKTQILWGLVLVFHLSYHLFWGVCYHSPALLEKKTEVTLVQAVKVSRMLIDRANLLRQTLPNEEIGMEACIASQEWGNSIIEAQREVKFLLQNRKMINFISVKPSLFGEFLSYMGILGYYNPFTAEATINIFQPDTLLPFTISHEMAHQMGYASESDANVVGYILSTNSNDKRLEYSALLFGIRHVLHYIYQQNPQAALSLESTLSLAIKNDIQKEKNYYSKYNGWINTVFHNLNDWFLKANRQDGVVTYSQATTKIIRYEMERNIYR